MEENQEKDTEIISNRTAYFANDFDEEEIEQPEIEEDLALEDDDDDEEQESEKAISVSEKTENNEAPKEEPLVEVIKEEEEEKKEEKEQVQEEELPEISPWEQFAADNSVVKKYIIYISKEFTPCIDNLSRDQRSAYINDAIQLKIDLEDEEKQKAKKRRMTTHLVIAIITFLVMTPLALLGVNKAIMMTFENYKYSQDNFEKLYKQRFEKDKAYMRSLEYNRAQQNKKKTNQF